MSAQRTRQRPPRYPLQLPRLHGSKAPGPAWTGVGWTRNVSEGRRTEVSRTA